MKKIINTLLATLLFIVCLTSLVYGEAEHAHCDHGKNSCDQDDASIVWNPITALTNDMASGYYYLDADIELGGDSWTIGTGADIHLCLNGHCIKTTQYIGTAYMIDVLGKLTITDCNAKAGEVKSIHSAGMIQVKGGELNICNGNFIHTRHNANLVHALDGGKVIINGGNFANEASELSDLSNLYGFFVAKGKNDARSSEITINNGKFTVNKVNNKFTVSTFTPYLINSDTDGKIYINGGVFNAEDYGYSKYSFDNTTITGGVFNTNSLLMNDANTIDLATKVGEDYRLKTVAEGYEVEKIEAFKIGTKTYSSLTKALNEAADNDIITVLENCELNDAYIIDKKVKLNLNGFTLEMKKESNQIFDIINNGELTIEDSSEEKTGKLSSINKSPTLIRVSGGELIINGGNFEVQVNTYLSYSHVVNCQQGKATLNGGTYSILEGNAESGDNLYSSVVAATRTSDTGISIVDINGGTYNASENTSGTHKFSSRIFTPYKGDTNYDFGTINVSGGYFNGDYNNPELTNVDGYLNINGGSFDRKDFSNNIELKDLINTSIYYVKSYGTPERYTVSLIPEKDNSSIGYSFVITGIE